MRKNYFVDENAGFFVKQKRQANVKMPMNGNFQLLYCFHIIILYHTIIFEQNNYRPKSNGRYVKR
jgi:hypothetical protein